MSVRKKRTSLFDDSDYIKWSVIQKLMNHLEQSFPQRINAVYDDRSIIYSYIKLKLSRHSSVFFHVNLYNVMLRQRPTQPAH